jgi:hypothetical protein
VAKKTDKPTTPKKGGGNPPPRRTNRTQPTRNVNARGTLNRIGALWIGEGKKGKFMSGRIELSENQEVRILVFKNGYKENNSHPDYIIYEPETPQESRGRNDQATGRGNATHSDDEIPF